MLATKHLLVAIGFHGIFPIILWKSVATSSCLVTNIFLLCSTEESQIGLDQLEGEHLMVEVSVLGELSL